MQRIQERILIHPYGIVDSLTCSRVNTFLNALVRVHYRVSGCVDDGSHIIKVLIGSNLFIQVLQRKYHLIGQAQHTVATYHLCLLYFGLSHCQTLTVEHQQAVSRLDSLIRERCNVVAHDSQCIPCAQFCQSCIGGSQHGIVVASRKHLVVSSRLQQTFEGREVLLCLDGCIYATGYRTGNACVVVPLVVTAYHKGTAGSQQNGHLHYIL